MLRQPLIELLNARHEPVRLAAVMDWRLIAELFSKTGSSALPPRIVPGLLYLQYAYDCSDEVSVNAWVENLYWWHYTAPLFRAEYLKTIDKSFLIIHG